MADLSVKVSTPTQGVKEFEASSKPLETKLLGYNFDTDNDYTVPLKFDDKKVFVTPDQVETMKLLGKDGVKQGDAVSVVIKGKTYSMSAQEMMKQFPK